MQLDELILKFTWMVRRARIFKNNLKNNTRCVEGDKPCLPAIKIYYKAVVIKMVWYWHKNRQINQWNRIQSPETDLEP